MTQSAAEIEQLIRDTFELAEPPSATSFSVSDQFHNEQNHPAGIRAPHAIEALQDAQSVDRWAGGDDSAVWIALAPRTDTRPYAALIVAIETTTMGPEPKIDKAWRLYGAWPETPTGALAAFIARFGIEVLVGGGAARGLFVARWNGHADQIVNVPTGTGRDFSVGAMFRQDGPGPMEVSWAYAIDDAAYGRYVQENR